MDDSRFDQMARGFESRLTRRRAGGLAAGALLALGLATNSDAKKKKKNKNKKGKGGSGGGGTTPVNYTCGNVGAACGNTLVCQCRLTTGTEQICLNGFAGSFPICLTNANCGAGTYCDLLTNRCAAVCPN